MKVNILHTHKKIWNIYQLSLRKDEFECCFHLFRYDSIEINCDCIFAVKYSKTINVK